MRRMGWTAAAVAGLAMVWTVSGAHSQSAFDMNAYRDNPTAFSFGDGSGGRNYTKIPRELIDYSGPHANSTGTIVINTTERRLYLVMGNGKAMRYGIGVGRPGFTWGGTHSVTRKAEWPGWTPPPPMRKRQPNLPAFMPGGPDNPLGARALYLGSTIYRIHGTSEPWTIGQAVSSGCFRMTNEDVTDLYERVRVGARVVVVR